MQRFRGVLSAVLVVLLVFESIPKAQAQAAPLVNVGMRTLLQRIVPTIVSRAGGAAANDATMLATLDKVTGYAQGAANAANYAALGATVVGAVVTGSWIAAAAALGVFGITKLFDVGEFSVEIVGPVTQPTGVDVKPSATPKPAGWSVQGPLPPWNDTEATDASTGAVTYAYPTLYRTVPTSQGSNQCQLAGCQAMSDLPQSMLFYASPAINLPDGTFCTYCSVGGMTPQDVTKQYAEALQASWSRQYQVKQSMFALGTITQNNMGTPGFYGPFESNAMWAWQRRVISGDGVNYIWQNEGNSALHITVVRNPYFVSHMTGTLQQLETQVPGLANMPVAPATVADTLNRAWQFASTQTGYDGVPWSSANPINASDVTTNLASNEGVTFNEFATTVISANPLTPTTQPGGGGTDPGTGTGTACGTSSDCKVKVNEAGTTEGAQPAVDRVASALGVVDGMKTRAESGDLSDFGAHPFDPSQFSDKVGPSIFGVGSGRSCSDIAGSWHSIPVTVDVCRWRGNYMPYLNFMMFAVTAIYIWRRFTGAEQGGTE
jgi:hypothetical protein